MLARVHTIRGCVCYDIGNLVPAVALCISASVGRNGVNVRKDVAAIQAALNKVPPLFGGPNPKLAVDGDAWSQTRAAIEKFQQKQLGWSDGLISVAGPSLVRLAALSGGAGLEAVSAPEPTRTERASARLKRANNLLPFLKKTALDAQWCARAASTFVNDGFIGNIDNLEPRNAFDIADRYFEFSRSNDSQTLAELAFIAAMCRRVATAIALRLGEVYGYPMGTPLFAIDKMSPARVWAYSPRWSKPATINFNAAHIYLCDPMDDQDDEHFQRTLCHEMFHFVDDETSSGQIVDHAPHGRALELTHSLRMHNADNYALFAMHATTRRRPSVW